LKSDNAQTHTQEQTPQTFHLIQDLKFYFQRNEKDLPIKSNCLILRIELKITVHAVTFTTNIEIVEEKEEAAEEGVKNYQQILLKIQHLLISTEYLETCTQ
jgi:hypothetical protein